MLCVSKKAKRVGLIIFRCRLRLGLRRTEACYDEAMRKQWLFLLGWLLVLALPRPAWALQFVPHLISVEAGVIKPGGIAIGDLDADKDMDIVTAGVSGVRVYSNDGKNNFSPKTLDVAPAEQVKLMDINGDNRLDIVVASPEHTLVWYENRGGLDFSRTDFASES